MRVDCTETWDRPVWGRAWTWPIISAASNTAKVLARAQIWRLRVESEFDWTLSSCYLNPAPKPGRAVREPLTRLQRNVFKVRNTERWLCLCFLHLNVCECWWTEKRKLQSEGERCMRMSSCNLWVCFSRFVCFNFSVALRGAETQASHPASALLECSSNVRLLHCFLHLYQKYWSYLVYVSISS